MSDDTINTTPSPVNDITSDSSQAVSTPIAPRSPEGPSMEAFPMPIRKVESQPVVETQKPQVETLLAPEMPSAPEPTPTVQDIKPDPIYVPPVVTQPVVNLVDKRTNDEVLAAHLKSSQPLTLEADEDEKDFIEHVEQAHQSI